MAKSYDLEAFSSRISIRAKEVAANAEKIVRRAAVAADGALILTTPRDTGRAAGNWNVSIGRVNTSVRELNFPDQSGAMAEGQARLGKWKLGSGTIFIANSLPYILPLEHGSSAKAPNGMMQHALIAARQQIRGGKLLG